LFNETYNLTLIYAEFWTNRDNDSGM
jgi:hypothetical protein